MSHRTRVRVRQRARNGQPEPYWRTDGRWAVAVDLGRRPDGKRRRHHVYGRSAEEATQRATLVRGRASAEEEHKLWGPHAKLADWAEEWVRRKEPRWDASGRRTGIKHSSWRPYRRHVRLDIAPALIGRTSLDRLNARMIREWVEFLGSEERGLGPRSVAYALETLKLVLKAAVAEEIIERNPALNVSAPSQTAYDAQVLTLEQSRRFLRVIRGHRDEALILLSVFAGPRQGETLSLRREDIDLDTGVVRFTQTLDWIEGDPVAEENKSPTSRRAVTLPPYVVDVLRRHLDEQAQKGAKEQERQRSGAAEPGGAAKPGGAAEPGGAAQPSEWTDYGLVFTGTRGQPLRGSTVYRRLHRLLAANDLPILRWHDLRHSAASIMLALGLSLHTVQKVIGHASLEMLSRRYGHLVPELAAEEVAKLQTALIDFEGAAASS
jgi:integrase